MKFEEAIVLLRQGKKVKRKAWSKDHTYLMFEGSGIRNSNKDTYNVFHIEDYEADDWEIYEEEPKLSIDNIIYVAVKNIRPLTKEEMDFFDKWYKKEFGEVD